MVLKLAVIGARIADVQDPPCFGPVSFFQRAAYHLSKVQQGSDDACCHTSVQLDMFGCLTRARFFSSDSPRKHQQSQVSSKRETRQCLHDPSRTSGIPLVSNKRVQVHPAELLLLITRPKKRGVVHCHIYIVTSCVYLYTNLHQRRGISSLRISLSLFFLCTLSSQFLSMCLPFARSFLEKTKVLHTTSCVHASNGFQVGCHGVRAGADLPFAVLCA